jgi:hypothetical protein
VSPPQTNRFPWPSLCPRRPGCPPCPARHHFRRLCPRPCPRPCHLHLLLPRPLPHPLPRRRPCRLPPCRRRRRHPGQLTAFGRVRACAQCRCGVRRRGGAVLRRGPGSYLPGRGRRGGYWGYDTSVTTRNKAGGTGKSVFGLVRACAQYRCGVQRRRRGGAILQPKRGNCQPVGVWGG